MAEVLFLSRIYSQQDRASQRRGLAEGEEEGRVIRNVCGYLSRDCDKLLRQSSLRVYFGMGGGGAMW